MKCINGLGCFDFLWKIIPHKAAREYLMLCLKYSVLGLGGIKQPAAVDLRLILVLALFLKVKFSDKYVGTKSL